MEIKWSRGDNGDQVELLGRDENSWNRYHPYENNCQLVRNFSDFKV
jgi:hypothetical protein